MTPSPLLSESPEVIDALDGELAYINSLSQNGRADEVDHGVAGQLVTLHEYLAQATKAWTSNAGDEAALEVIRKLAGTCLRALILYGCPTRTPPQDGQEIGLAMQVGMVRDTEGAKQRLEEYQFEKAVEDVIARLARVGLTIDEESLQALIWKKGTVPPQIINGRLYPGGGNTPIVEDIRLSPNPGHTPVFKDGSPIGDGPRDLSRDPY